MFTAVNAKENECFQESFWRMWVSKEFSAVKSKLLESHRPFQILPMNGTIRMGRCLELQRNSSCPTNSEPLEIMYGWTIWKRHITIKSRKGADRGTSRRWRGTVFVWDFMHTTCSRHKTNFNIQLPLGRKTGPIHRPQNLIYWSFYD